MRLARGATTEKFTPRGVTEAPSGQGCPIRIAGKGLVGSGARLEPVPQVRPYPPWPFPFPCRIVSPAGHRSR
jgi:hypothetical protein